MRKWLAALTVGLLLFTGVPATATTLTGRVISIADGDTFTLVDAAMKQTRIRLAEIDAPEKSQPYGQKSRWHLSKLVFGKSVNVRVVNIETGTELARFDLSEDASEDNAVMFGELTREGIGWKFKAVGTTEQGETVPGGGPLTERHNVVFDRPDAAEVQPGDVVRQDVGPGQAQRGAQRHQHADIQHHDGREEEVFGRRAFGQIVVPEQRDNHVLFLTCLAGPSRC